MSWIIKKFEELTNSELHDIFKLRVDIFIVEQNCPYPEIDGKDPQCLHLFFKDCDNIKAYARILPPGLSYTEPSIGRVIVSADSRGTGLGYKLLDESVKASLKEYNQPIKIGAQAHLEKYYGVYGFEKVSDEYLEDDIPHIDMLRKL